MAKNNPITAGYEVIREGGGVSTIDLQKGDIVTKVILKPKISGGGYKVSTAEGIKTEREIKREQEKVSEKGIKISEPKRIEGEGFKGFTYQEQIEIGRGEKRLKKNVGESQAAYERRLAERGKRLIAIKGPTFKDVTKTPISTGITGGVSSFVGPPEPYDPYLKEAISQGLLKPKDVLMIGPTPKTSFTISKKPSIYFTSEPPQSRESFYLFTSPFLKVGGAVRNILAGEKDILIEKPTKIKGWERSLEKYTPKFVKEYILTEEMLALQTTGGFFGPYISTGAVAKEKTAQKTMQQQLREFNKQFSKKEVESGILKTQSQIEKAFIKRGTKGAEKEAIKLFKSIKTQEARAGFGQLLKNLQAKGVIKGFALNVQTGKLAFFKTPEIIFQIPKTIPIQEPIVFTNIFEKQMERFKIKYPKQELIQPKQPKISFELPKETTKPRQKQIPLLRQPQGFRQRQKQKQKQISLLGQPQLPKQTQPQLPKQTQPTRQQQPQLQLPKIDFPFPSFPKSPGRITRQPQRKFPIPLFKFPEGKIIGERRRKVKKVSRKSKGKYTPTIAALSLGLKAFKIPKGYKFGAGGIMQRPIISKKRRKKKKK